MKNGELIEAVKAVYRFNRETGVFTWRFGTTKYPAGSKAGALVRGYVVLVVKGRRYLAHRLVFLLEHGWLPRLVDHKNGVILDNRPANLRPARKSSNATNRSAFSRFAASGYVGVVWDKQCCKWKVRVQKDGRQVINRTFVEMDEAIAVRLEVASRAHGEFAARL